jgi:hypothetical protein
MYAIERRFTVLGKDVVYILDLHSPGPEAF